MTHCIYSIFFFVKNIDKDIKSKKVNGRNSMHKIPNQVDSSKVSSV